MTQLDKRGTTRTVPKPNESAKAVEAWTAPPCPRCGGDMVLRIPWSTRPVYAFWGCRQYPRCPGTRSGSSAGRQTGPGFPQEKA
jgi:ssDNA-binding Zn-finger/Zn-ribbon topoisomerase 1